MSTAEPAERETSAEISASPVPPHLLAECQGLYIAWRPEDPGAAYAALPEGLERPADPVVSMALMAQSGPHTSWGGTASITHAEIEVAGRDALDGRSRGCWWVLYVNGDPWYLAGAKMLGVPGAEEGRTEIIADERLLTAVTHRGERPIIRTTVRLGEATGAAGGQFRYLIPGDGYPSILVPWACEGHAIGVEAIDFLDRSDPSWALRPSDPLEVAWAVYSPRFCYAFSAPQPVA